MNILFINNYDSFVYNLVNYICQLELDSNIIVEDNNKPIDYIENLEAEVDIISPGCAISPLCSNSNLQILSNSIDNWKRNVSKQLFEN